MGKFNYKWAIFNSKLFVYQRVVVAHGAINDPCVFVIFADWMQVAIEIDACATDVTSLGGVGWGC